MRERAVAGLYFGITMIASAATLAFGHHGSEPRLVMYHYEEDDAGIQALVDDPAPGYVASHDTLIRMHTLPAIYRTVYLRQPDGGVAFVDLTDAGWIGHGINCAR